MLESGAEATDDRDKVFSLLSLASEIRSPLKDPITPDYD
jgi:hypothetical protein